MSELKIADPEALSRWIKVYLATVVGDPADSIDSSAPLSEYDLDSIDAVTMALEMEKMFDISVHPETFLDGDASIDDIVEQMS